MRTVPRDEETIAALPKIGLPPFATLRAFEALVRLGGIRKAAQSLSLHHSVVSRHLTHLESWLGVSLLHWSGKRFELTTDGKRYHARIAAAIAEIESATSEVLGREAARPLRIFCSLGLSIQWLASQITDFERLHPNFQIELHPSDTPANLNIHEADVNIYFHLDDNPANSAGDGVKAHVLVRPQTMLAASPDLVRRFADITSANDLINMPLLHGNQRNDWRSWLVRHGVDVPEHLPGEMCWNPHMALEAARLGRGILLANGFFFERDLARGDLLELHVPGTTHSAFGEYLFCAREDRWSVPGIVAVRNFLTARMRVMEDIFEEN